MLALGDRPAPPRSPSPLTCSVLPSLTCFCCRRGTLLLIEPSELSSPVTLRPPQACRRSVGSVPPTGIQLRGRCLRPVISFFFLAFFLLLCRACRRAPLDIHASQISSSDRIAGYLKVFLWSIEGAQTMDAEAKQGAYCSIKKTLRRCIRVSWRYASEHRALFSLALLLYLLYRSSPGFCAFLLSSSPVIVCTTILLGTLLNYGIKDPPEMDESETAPDNSAPKFGSYSRNVHSEAYTRSLVPAVKDNIIREASFGRRHSNNHLDLDEDDPLLEGVCQGDDEVDAAGSRLGKMLISIPSTEAMQQDAAMVDKDAFLSKKDEHANLFDAVHQSGVDGKETTLREDVEILTEPNHQGRAESQSGEVGLGHASEHKAADGEAGKRRWGRAFSVRQRKKLADIKIEAINPAAENQLDHSLLSPFTRAGSHDYDCLAGFDPDNAEIYSLDVPMTNTAPVPGATETDPLSAADFSSPDPTNTDNSENRPNVCSLDSGTGSGCNVVADNGKAKEDGEEKRKDAGNEPAFLWTADDEKNGMDLGYSEMERNRRLEILMARRKSRRHTSFELEGNAVSSFRPQALAISSRRLNPFADDAEVPGSAPSVLHLRKDPFDFLSEQSNDSDIPAPHQDMPSFKRHESFSFSRPQQRHVPRFKPLEEFSLGEAAGGSDFQRQFSDRSVSRLSVVSECDTVSSVGDPEHNELIRNNYIRGVREESPSPLRQDSDLSCAGNECSDLGSALGTTKL